MTAHKSIDTSRYEIAVNILRGVHRTNNPTEIETVNELIEKIQSQISDQNLNLCIAALLLILDNAVSELDSPEGLVQ